VLRESKAVYRAASEGVINLADKFFEMERTNALRWVGGGVDAGAQRRSRTGRQLQASLHSHTTASLLDFCGKGRL
jgi:hypothetical protein